MTGLFIVLLVLIPVVMIVMILRVGKDTPEPYYRPMPITVSAREVLEELRWKEELEREYKWVTGWELYGEVIENPTPEQKVNPALIRTDHWEKRNPGECDKGGER